MTARTWLPRLTLFSAIAGAVVWATLNRERFEPEALDIWISSFGIWAPVAYVALYASATVLFVPGSLITLAGGALFGPLWGTVLSLAGATTGAAIAFLVARYFAGDWVARQSSGWLKRLIDGVEAEGWRFVALVRLVPLFPFNLTNYALGLTGIGFWSYVATSFVCMAPGAVAYTWLGHAGREAFAGNASAIRYGFLALGLLVAIAFLPRLVSRIRGDATSWIEPQDLLGLCERGAQRTIIVDVRNPDEFTGTLGHIPEAINIPLGEIGGRLDELGRGPDVAIAIVCRTDRRSAVAARELRNAGFSDVRVLRGGMEGWNQRGYTTIRDVNVTPHTKRRRNAG